LPYETCRDVNEKFWEELAARDPKEVAGRTGARWETRGYLLPLLNRELLIDPAARRATILQDPGAEPGFRTCLTALLYLLKIDPEALGPLASPLELPGGATFFRGLHGLPNPLLEARFGSDAAGFLASGSRLGGQPHPAGDAALSFQVYPGLNIIVILWQADDEFPAQVSFAVPAHIHQFWGLDALWGLLHLLTQELLHSGSQ